MQSCTTQPAIFGKTRNTGVVILLMVDAEHTTQPEISGEMRNSGAVILKIVWNTPFPNKKSSLGQYSIIPVACCHLRHPRIYRSINTNSTTMHPARPYRVPQVLLVPRGPVPGSQLICLDAQTSMHDTHPRGVP